MSDECATCGCNGSGCPVGDPVEDQPLSEAEIDDLEAVYRMMRR